MLSGVKVQSQNEQNGFESTGFEIWICSGFGA
jgi:hypothetical protein